MYQLTQQQKKERKVKVNALIMSISLFFLQVRSDDGGVVCFFRANQTKKHFELFYVAEERKHQFRQKPPCLVETM